MYIRDLRSVKTDLHIHTNCSDGSYTPAEIVSLAVTQHVGILSFADHDILSTSETEYKAAAQHGILLIPGIEISSEINGQSLHLLGYGFDAQHPACVDLIASLQNNRHQRNLRMLEKCAEQGIPITMEELCAVAGGTIISRPHFAVVMLAKKIVKTPYEAFTTYLGTGALCHVPRIKIPAAEVIATMHSAGGISVLAHPGLLPYNFPEEYGSFIDTLLKSGLDGLEVFSAAHTTQQSNMFLKLAKKRPLLITGGSDFHGTLKPRVALGKYYGADAVFPHMREFLIHKGYIHE